MQLKGVSRMSFTQINSTQNAFLHDYLRGRNRSLTSRQAQSLFGIRNLRARMTELRDAGLRVRTEKNTEGYTRYRVSARDIFGSRASLTN